MQAITKVDPNFPSPPPHVTSQFKWLSLGNSPCGIWSCLWIPIVYFQRTVQPFLHRSNFHHKLIYSSESIKLSSLHPRFIQFKTTYDCLPNVANHSYSRYCVSICLFSFSLVVLSYYPSTERPWKMMHTSRHLFTRSCYRICFTVWMHESWNESSLTDPKILMPEMVVSRYVGVSCNFPLFFVPLTFQAFGIISQRDWRLNCTCAWIRKGLIQGYGIPTTYQR